jgi:Nuclease-related domain
MGNVGAHGCAPCPRLIKCRDGPTFNPIENLGVAKAVEFGRGHIIMTVAPEINEAIKLYNAGQQPQSLEILRTYLVQAPSLKDGLLWLAKVSNDKHEAIAAAELAFALFPNEEVTQRAVAAVSLRFKDKNDPASAIDVLRIAGMTQAQARLVIWPFRNLYRPIGVLLDEGKLTVKDLGFAVETAFDPQLKRAATTLLLGKLLSDGLKEPPPPMQVFGLGSHAARRARFGFMLFGFALSPLVIALITGIGLLVPFISLWLIGSSAFKSFALPLAINFLAVIILFPVSTWLVDWLGDWISANRLGAEGEDKVADTLKASLHSPWTLFRNVEWPNRKWGDVDSILVGPGGIYAIEVKAYTKETRNLGDTWQQKGRWRWWNLSSSPAKQARRNAVNTKNYLDLHGLRVKWVEAIVVWAGDEEKLTLENPATPVWILANLSDRLEVVWEQGRLSDEEVVKAIEILKQVMDEMKARDDKEYEKYK